MRKVKLFVAFLGLSGLLISASASAQPECRGPHGELRCDIPGCHKFCDHHHGPGAHKAPPPPAAHHHHAPPPPAHHPAPPPPRRVVVPVPPPPPPPPTPSAVPRFKLERELMDLRRDNERLRHERDIALIEAEHSYEACLHLPYPVSRRCIRPMGDVNRIDAQIASNNAEIVRLERALGYR